MSIAIPKYEGACRASAAYSTSVSHRSAGCGSGVAARGAAGDDAGRAAIQGDDGQGEQAVDVSALACWYADECDVTCEQSPLIPLPGVRLETKGPLRYKTVGVQEAGVISFVA